MAENFLKKTEDELKKLPKWAWFVAIGAGVLVVYEIKKSQSNTQQGVPASSVNGLDQGSLGQDQWQYYMDSGQEPPGYYGGNPQPPPPSPSPGSGGTANIRSQEGQGGPFYNWDKGHSGVPLRSSPSLSGSITSLLPFNQQVTITGAPVQGDSNDGNSEWYPVNGGYVSGADLININLSGGQGGASGSFDEWHRLHSAYHTDITSLAMLTDLGLFA